MGHVLTCTFFSLFSMTSHFLILVLVIYNKNHNIYKPKFLIMLKLCQATATHAFSSSYSMQPDSDKIDLIAPPTFKKEAWIGKKHIYSPALPLYVIKACDKAIDIPKHEMSRIPPAGLTVGDLMRNDIPRVESGWPLYKAEMWFNNDTPHMTLDCLEKRPIPNKKFLEKLENAARQAWLDGAQSLVDQRYN